MTIQMSITNGTIQFEYIEHIIFYVSILYIIFNNLAICTAREGNYELEIFKVVRNMFCDTVTIMRSEPST
jgi:hypothetical protein